jgi:aspartyl-tRNA(Asn)/glutamyl-tRNA(Gln) amidotransferase subunit A
MAATVEDAALLLQTIAGQDPKDPSSAAEVVPDYVGALHSGIKGLRVGLPERHFSEGMHTDVEKAYRQAVAVIATLGATIVSVDIPHANLATPAGNLIAMAEAATFHDKRLREAPELFDPLVRERLDTAGFYLATDYIKAQRLRTLLSTEILDALNRCDVIAVPAYPRLPARVESPEAARTDVAAGASSETYRASNSYIANMTGIPALVLPCGFSSGAPPLPIALQLYGRHFDESTLLRIGHAYQQATDWHTHRPPQ